ncbi:MAG TPA: hypothetical protein VGU20_01305 [Stellaceae bacterium]|nr:hypothetical protein [Stellaceae bacterium]
MFPLVVDRDRSLAFPEAPTALPWPLVEAHENQALINHGQPIAELAKNGGIDWSEMVAVLEDRPWHWTSVGQAAERLEELFADWVFTLPKQMKAAAQKPMMGTE